MPPNDPLFDSEPAKPNGGDPAPVEETAPQAGISPEMFAQGIEQLVGPLREQIGELSAAVSRMNQAPVNREPVHSPEPEADFLTSFSNNPEGAIKNVVSGELKGLAPFLNTILEGGSSAFVDIEAQRIDQEFGKGAWEKFYQKPMGEIVQTYQTKQPTALGDRGVIRREVDGLTGRMVGKLIEHQQEFRTKTEKDETEKVGVLQENILKEAMKRTSLTGGIRRMPTGEQEVTEELKGYLKERMDAIGLEQDPKDFLKQTDYGNTLEEYEAHQTKLSGGKQ
jgi:hypothetical protein